eukprot:gene4865-9693_t
MENQSKLLVASSETEVVNEPKRRRSSVTLGDVLLAKEKDREVQERIRRVSGNEETMQRLGIISNDVLIRRLSTNDEKLVKDLHRSSEGGDNSRRGSVSQSNSRRGSKLQQDMSGAIKFASNSDEDKIIIIPNDMYDDNPLPRKTLDKLLPAVKEKSTHTRSFDVDARRLSNAGEGVVVVTQSQGHSQSVSGLGLGSKPQSLIFFDDSDITENKSVVIHTSEDIVSRFSTSTELLKRSSDTTGETSLARDLSRKLVAARSQESMVVAKPMAMATAMAAKEFISQHIDEVLTQKKVLQLVTTGDVTSQALHSLTFDEKLLHPELLELPLKSQVAQQNLLRPKHTTEKRRRVLAVCKQLRRNDAHMIKCNLNDEGIDAELCRQIATALTKNRCMEHLLLNHNAITDEGVDVLCKGLHHHPSIKSLWLATNQITDVGVKHLCALIDTNKTLVELNLCTKWPKSTWSRAEEVWFPHITSPGAYLLSLQLEKKNCNLTSLALSDQRVCDEGARALFRQVSGSLLRTLHLAGNHLTDLCCETLRDTLLTWSDLEVLDVSRNGITDAGAVLVAYGLERNDVLQSLNISENVIGDVGMQAFFEAFENNMTIFALNTFGNLSADDRAEHGANMRFIARSASLAGLSTPLSTVGTGKGKGLASLEAQMISAQPLVHFPDDNDLMGIGMGMGMVVADSGRMVQSPSSTMPMSTMTMTMSSRPVSPLSHTALLTTQTLPTSGRNTPLHPMRPRSRARFDTTGKRFDKTAMDEGGRVVMDDSESSPIDNDRMHASSYVSSLTRSRDSDLSSEDSYLTARSNRSRKLSRTHVSRRFKIVKKKRFRRRIKLPPQPPKRDIEFERGFHERIVYKRDVVPLETTTTTTTVTTTTSNGNLNHTITAVPGNVTNNSIIRVSSRQGMGLGLGLEGASSELGKGLGVPYLGCRGKTPVRSGQQRHGQGDHLFYMSVATPADELDATPFPVVLIGANRREERRRVANVRKTQSYLEEKAAKLAAEPKERRLAGRYIPPKRFWKEIEHNVVSRYPKGIDRAPGVKFPLDDSDDMMTSNRSGQQKGITTNTTNGGSTSKSTVMSSMSKGLLHKDKDSDQMYSNGQTRGDEGKHSVSHLIDPGEGHVKRGGGTSGTTRSFKKTQTQDDDEIDNDNNGHLLLPKLKVHLSFKKPLSPNNTVHSTDNGVGDMSLPLSSPLSRTESWKSLTADASRSPGAAPRLHGIKGLLGMSPNQDIASVLTRKKLRIIPLHFFNLETTSLWLIHKLDSNHFVKISFALEATEKELFWYDWRSSRLKGRGREARGL